MIDYRSIEETTAKHGRFFFPKNDIYIGRSLKIYGQYCEQEVQLFKQLIRAGDFVVEAGANIGAFSIPISKKLGPKGALYAFEPQAFIATILSHNLLINGCENARVLTTALGDKLGHVDIPVLDYSKAANFGGYSFKEKSQTAKAHISVPMSSLDQMIDPPRLRFIKADVEKMELQFLKGATGLIKKHQPFVYLECDKAEQAGDLLDHLHGLDYKCYWHVSRFFNVENWANNTENEFGNVCCVNIFAAPKKATVKNFVKAKDAASHPRNIKAD